MFCVSLRSSFMRLRRLASFLSCSDFFDFSVCVVVLDFLFFVSRMLILPNDSSNIPSRFLAASVCTLVFENVK
jgi:hypothetical protein